MDVYRFLFIFSVNLIHIICVLLLLMLLFLFLYVGYAIDQLLKVLLLSLKLSSFVNFVEPDIKLKPLLNCMKRTLVWALKDTCL